MRKLIITLLAICFISGCGAVKPVEFAGDVAQESVKIVSGVGDFVFEILAPKEHLHLKDVTSYYDDDGQLVVTGKVKRGTKLCCDRVTGHVDIAIFDSEGSAVDIFSTWLSPRYIPKRRTKSSSFKVLIPIELPKGASIRVAYHSTTNLEKAGHANDRLDCGENMAFLSDETGSVEIAP